ncbi:DNA-directed RNA polymerase subunit K [Candidatus Pacearchaeota archaeon]|nr:DNA-directed RNA polymerase subunit K [Candidatus Pacearchaeota archaeon]
MEKFTRYETARIIGARALQIAMDAPVILKISEQKLKELRYDSLKIAELEFNEGVLPISVDRPTPRKHKEKLTVIKEEKVSDEEIAAKEHEIEKEITENAEQLGLIAGDEVEDFTDAEPVYKDEQ